MLNSIKNILIIALILASAIGAFVLYTHFKKEKVNRAVAEIEANRYKIELVSSKYQDSITQLSLKNAINLTNDENSQLKRDLELMGIKLKDAVNNTRVVTQTKIDKQLIHDTLNHTEYYIDPYAQIELDSLRNIHINLTDTLRQVTYKKVIDGKEYLQVRAKNSNPYIKITDLSSVNIPITKEKSRWGISLYAGYGVGITPDKKFTKFEPQIGVGVSFNLIRFNGK